MFCPRCGARNDDKNFACTHCGYVFKKIKKSSQKGSGIPFNIQKGRYLIIQKLGSGGMGRVFLARDTKMDCNVVIKEVTAPEEFPEKKEYILKKFTNEAKVLFRLAHPRIPKVLDYFSEGNHHYIIMEYIDGENLERIVKNRPNRQITIEEFIDWMEKLLDVLEYLHNQKPPILHRDIKPANIMLNPKGELFLVDFGISRILDTSTSTQTRIGTIGFASPEHFTGKFVLASDIYSLGATFHFLLTGSNPFDRAPFEFPPLHRYRDDIPQSLEILFNKMLQKDPKKRFQNIAQLKDSFYMFVKHYQEIKEMKKALEEKPEPSEPPPEVPKTYRKETVPVSPPTKPTKPQAPKKKSKILIPVLSVLLICSLIATLLVIRHKQIIKIFHSPKTHSKKPKIHKPTPTPSSPALLILKANQLLEEEKYDKALKLYSTIIEKDKDKKFITAYIGRGKAYMAKGDFEKALQDFSTYLEEEPEDTEAIEEHMDAAEKLERYKVAIEDAKKLIKLSKIPEEKQDFKDKFISLTLIYAKKLARQDEIDAAISNVLPLYHKYPNNKSVKKTLAFLYAKKADIFFEKEDYANAIQYFTKALTVQPNNIGTLLLRAVAYRSIGDLDNSIKDLKHILKITPKNKGAMKTLVSVLNQRGVLRIRENKISSGIKDLKEALKLSPDNKNIKENIAKAYYIKAERYFLRDKIPEALKYIDIALKYSHNCDTLTLKALCYMKDGKYISAIQCATEAIDKDPNCPKAFLVRGDAYFKILNYSKAIQDWEEAAKYEGRVGKIARKRIKKFSIQKTNPYPIPPPLPSIPPPHIQKNTPNDFKLF